MKKTDSTIYDEFAVTRTDSSNNGEMVSIVLSHQNANDIEICLTFVGAMNLMAATMRLVKDADKKRKKKIPTGMPISLATASITLRPIDSRFVVAGGRCCLSFVSDTAPTVEVEMNEGKLQEMIRAAKLAIQDIREYSVAPKAKPN